jgi:4'-phosphopantetheinyl transferase EntD
LGLVAEDARRGVPFAVGVGLRREGDGPVPALFAVEEACLSPRVAERRRFFFTLGRAAARDALSELGVAPVGIGCGPGGEPLWPDGIVGAISHTGDLAIAIVGWRTEYAGLGVDVEQLTPGLSERGARLVCAPSEIAWAAEGDVRSPNRHAGPNRPESQTEPDSQTGPGSQRGPDGQTGPGSQMGLVRPTRSNEARPDDLELDQAGVRRTMIFSAKEAVFKATYPIERVWLGFGDAELTWVPSRSGFDARLRKQASQFLPIGAVLQVQCSLTPTQVLSTAYIVSERVASECVVSERVVSERVASEPAASEPMASEPIASERV